jgi:NADH:ubiquinone oxidoreductase subunit 3 (subunit A)
LHLQSQSLHGSFYFHKYTHLSTIQKQNNNKKTKETSYEPALTSSFSPRSQFSLHHTLWRIIFLLPDILLLV